MKAQLGGPADSGDRPEDLRGPLDELLAAGETTSGATAASGPGAVVVHDWYGSLPHVADLAAELEMAGSGVEPSDPGAAEVALARTIGSLHARLAG